MNASYQVKEDPNAKSWVPTYPPTQKEFNNLCLIALGQWNGEL